MEHAAPSQGWSSLETSRMAYGYRDEAYFFLKLRAAISRPIRAHQSLRSTAGSARAGSPDKTDASVHP